MLLRCSRCCRNLERFEQQEAEEEAAAAAAEEEGEQADRRQAMPVWGQRAVLCLPLCMPCLREAANHWCLPVNRNPFPRVSP